MKQIKLFEEFSQNVKYPDIKSIKDDIDDCFISYFDRFEGKSNKTSSKIEYYKWQLAQDIVKGDEWRSDMPTKIQDRFNLGLIPLYLYELNIPRNLDVKEQLNLLKRAYRLLSDDLLIYDLKVIWGIYTSKTTLVILFYSRKFTELAVPQEQIKIKELLQAKGYSAFSDKDKWESGDRKRFYTFNYAMRDFWRIEEVRYGPTFLNSYRFRDSRFLPNQPKDFGTKLTKRVTVLTRVLAELKRIFPKLGQTLAKTNLLLLCLRGRSTRKRVINTIKIEDTAIIKFFFEDEYGNNKRWVARDPHYSQLWISIHLLKEYSRLEKEFLEKDLLHLEAKLKPYEGRGCLRLPEEVLKKLRMR